MKEPYRLWFEFLKLALTDLSVTVDRNLYSDWGNVEGADFDDWWEINWRKLFAVPATTGAIESLEEFKAAIADPSCVVLRVSLASGKSQRLKEIADAISAHEMSHEPVEKRDAIERFSISSKRSMNRLALRNYLRVYKAWLKKGRNLDETAREVYRVVSSWNAKIAEKKWKRERIVLPGFFGSYVQMLDLIAAGKTGVNSKGRSIKNSVNAGSNNYDITRAKIRRYIRQAEKIAQNVGTGVFPGEF
jgi:hypothetical protein